jgi:hypothetical protein
VATATETVLCVLEDAGFERLPKPLVVAGSVFDFDAAARGSGLSHDLVVVATELNSPQRLVRLIGGLSRVLDQVESRRPVSVVVVGPALDAATIIALERHARVLTVGSEDPEPNEVRSAVAVLLPLLLPDVSSQGRDPLTEVAQAFGASLSDDHRAFLEAARIGPDAVREALRRYVDAAISGDSDEGADS